MERRHDDREDAREGYPSDTHRDDEGPNTGGHTVDEDRRTQTEGQYPPNEHSDAAPMGPGLASDPQGRAARGDDRPGTNPKYAEAKRRAGASGKQPEDDQLAYEAGDPEGMADERPVTTSTPGGTLGAPTEAELRNNQKEKSNVMDDRMDTDRR